MLRRALLFLALAGTAGADVAVLDFFGGGAPGGTVTLGVHDDFLGVEYCGGTCNAPPACALQVTVAAGTTSGAAADAIAAAINASTTCQLQTVTAVSDPGRPGRLVLRWPGDDYNVCVDGWLMRDRNRSCGLWLVTAAGDVKCRETKEISYCTAGVSASGCAPTLSARGNASAAGTTGFDVRATGVEGGSGGLLFFGIHGNQARPWGNGTSYQCVVPPVKRGSVLSGTGVPGTCTGSLVEDLNALWCASCPRPGHNPGLGAWVSVQLWYLDPLNTSNRSSSLSNAIHFPMDF